MLNTNFLHGVTGIVAEISTPTRAIINFELHGVTESAFLKCHRFYKAGKCIADNQNLGKYLKIGQKVKFSCHINDNSNPGQCRWFITNCWRHVENEMNTVVMSTGMMNVAGSVTDLKRRQGTLTMTDLLGNEHKIHFLASKFYSFGKRMAASKPLSSQLQIDDKLYFDAIPCFPEENNDKCNWFATCVHKGKKPENLTYRDQNKSEVGSEKSVKSETDFFVDQSYAGGESLPSHLTRQENFPGEFESVFAMYGDDKYSSELFAASETELANSKLKFGSDPGAKMLRDIKLLTTNPKTVFAMSVGIIMDIINEEYGVILGEFQRNNFQTVLFHRSNAFLFKTSLAHSKLNEIFIEGDRVRFIAVEAPKQFACDWIATQVSVASKDTKNIKDDDDSPNDLIAIKDLYES